MDNPYFVSSEWLAAHLGDPAIVIIDCRFSLTSPELGRQQYAEGHIPGAFYLHLNEDLSSPVQLHGGRHPLPNPTTLAEKLTAIGVNFSETLVVVYDDSRFAFAARLWWLLQYFGHNRVTLLDGGLAGWVSESCSLTSEVPAATKGNFIPQLQPHLVVDIETVKGRQELPGVVLVDSREPDRYWGKHEPIDPIAGHIPGAINCPWQEVSDHDGKVKSLLEQQQRWSEIRDSDEIIVYCGSGVTACVNLLSLTMAGISTGKLYAGSWSDWCSYLIEK